MKNDIHEISNELYKQGKKTIQDKEEKERKKKYQLNSIITLREEIDNFICENDTGNINDIQLKVLDNQDAIIDYATRQLINTGNYKASRLEINMDLKQKFLKEFNVVFKEYKTRYKIQKAIDKEKDIETYNDILNKLIEDFDNLNNQRRYDMKIVLKNMYSEEYKQDVFNYLDLDITTDYEEIYYKAVRELKRRKKDTIKEVIQDDIKVNKGLPLSWKCYGILKAINKLMK